jgi:hypothetical protein
MKILASSIVILMTTVLLCSCDTNKKLNQESAENAIKEFVTQNSFDTGSGQGGSFSVNSITSIEPISQFSETEASSIVHFDFQDSYANDKLVLKFNFKKNMDKKWVLTTVDAVSGVGSQNMSNKIYKWQNVNIIVTDKSSKETTQEKSFTESVCGEWQYKDPSQGYTEEVKNYSLLKITQAANGLFTIQKGSIDNGKIYWGNFDGSSGKGIDLNLSENKLIGKYRIYEGSAADAYSDINVSIALIDKNNLIFKDGDKSFEVTKKSS